MADLFDPELRKLRLPAATDPELEDAVVEVAILAASSLQPAAADESLDERAYPLCEALLQLKLAEPSGYRLLTDSLTEQDGPLQGQPSTSTTFAFRAAKHGDFLAGVHVARCRLVWDGSPEDLGRLVRVAYFTIDGAKILIPQPELEILSQPLRLLDATSE